MPSFSTELIGSEGWWVVGGAEVGPFFWNTAYWLDDLCGGFSLSLVSVPLGVWGGRKPWKIPFSDLF